MIVQVLLQVIGKPLKSFRDTSVKVITRDGLSPNREVQSLNEGWKTKVNSCQSKPSSKLGPFSCLTKRGL
jgi:hypothetical protein